MDHIIIRSIMHFGLKTKKVLSHIVDNSEQNKIGNNTSIVKSTLHFKLDFATFSLYYF